tara:strand:- start:51 stop:263 length:213 start_codon:yes stop_codon:yes gene_type:complete
MEDPFVKWRKLHAENKKLKEQLALERAAHRPTRKTGVKKKRRLGTKTRTKWEQKKAQAQFKKKNIYDKKR